METGTLPAGERATLTLQRAVGRLLSPLWVPAAVAVMRVALRWRIEGAAEARRVYQEQRRLGAPLLVCANHLTLVDSALVAWALGSPAWFLLHYASLPWNVPERRNFAASPFSRVAVYLMKCVPITRGGDRADIGRTLARLASLLARGEVVLVFPEGGRSRSGVVDAAQAAYGVGRLIAAVPGCRVLCVYLRGEHQTGFGDLPVVGEQFAVRVACLEPTSSAHGMRRARELATQVTERLAALERDYFAARSEPARMRSAR